MVGSRKDVEVAMDWTDFDAGNQTTIMLSLFTSHGRATPLVWLTVDKDTLKGNRNHYEYQVLVWFAEVLPADVKVLIVADRGSGDHKLYRVLTKELNSFVSVGISRSQPRTVKHRRPSTGLARVDACASYVAPPRRPRTILSERWFGLRPRTRRNLGVWRPASQINRPGSC
jgi:hypothetical protein